jgi:hypothetical protein
MNSFAQVSVTRYRRMDGGGIGLVLALDALCIGGNMPPLPAGTYYA